MMLILVVYYVIIAFLIDTNVIANPTSVPMENGSSSTIVVLNACSQDPPCFVSCAIGFDDVELHRSSILGFKEESHFHYANTTIGLQVTIFKHIDVQDPGTVIFTKKLGDDEDPCFTVRGDYSAPEISECLNSTNGTRFRVTNESSPPFILILQMYEGDQLTKWAKNICSTNIQDHLSTAPKYKERILEFRSTENGITNINHIWAHQSKNLTGR